jgi:acetyl esterase
MTNVRKAAVALALFGLTLTSSARAQTSAPGVPPAIWTQIQALGPVLDAGSVYRIYGSLRAAMPTDGVKRTSDVTYGPDPRNVVDIYEPSPRPATAAPVLIFVHGGAFVGGTNKTYENIGYYFARHGVVTVLPTYRVAPAHPWPAGVEDVGKAVRWTRDHAPEYNGDPARTFLFGHSAGATHVGAYALERRFQPRGGSGLAGVILASGLYDPALDAMWSTPAIIKPDGAYYGSDTSTYAARSTASHLDAPRIPTLIYEVELDPPEMVVGSGSVFSALCHRDRACPTFYRFLQYDHISSVAAINTGDETVSGSILDFIRGTGSAATPK